MSLNLGGGVGPAAPRSLARFSAMAVRAADFAFFNFSHDACPSAPASGINGDISNLIPDVIELENHNVSLATVHARVFPEVVDDVLAHFSASLCHLANISYRVGRKLTLSAGPKFVNDAEANKLLTRDSYRRPYVV